MSRACSACGALPGEPHRLDEQEWCPACPASGRCSACGRMWLTTRHYKRWSSEPGVYDGAEGLLLRVVPDRVQTALADALEGLRYKGIDHEAPHAPARFCDHAAEPCDRCEAARKALLLAGRKP